MRNHGHRLPEKDDQGLTILVAEDDTVQRLVLTALLEKEGYLVLAAETGLSAIALADAYAPDLLLIDAVMPQLSGFEVIAAIRTRPLHTTTPAIVISGLEDIESRMHALAIGADDFIVKPFDGREVLARVRAQLRMVDAWHGRVDGVISSLRATRSRIAQGSRQGNPIEVAQGLVSHLSAELGCSTIITIDAHGEQRFATEPFYAEDFNTIDFGSVPEGLAGATFMTSQTDGCSICGGPGEGSVQAIEAGKWNEGRALLLVGCSGGSSAGDARVVREVADSCQLVFGDRMPSWEADAEHVRWLDLVIDSAAYEMVFQPIVDIRSCRVIAQEALVRFDDGTIPDEALRIATMVGRRAELELALVASSLGNAVALPEGIRVHVNVSPETALDPGLSDLIAAADRRVVLEITENAMFSSANAERLRSSIPASCLLAADDVGAGYAGMSQLLDVRPDIVKLDRAVVSGIDTDAARQALVAGLVQFAQATRSFVVGEGVERFEEWQMLQQLGVDYGQGFYFSRPIRLAEAARMSRVERDHPTSARGIVQRRRELVPTAHS